MSNRFSRVGFVVLVGWLAILVLMMARGTFALPYLSDDFEHGRLIAQIRAGLRPASDLITVPFHGQTLVLLRLLFWLGTMPGGMSLTWVRLAVCAVHIAGAAGCAILCTRWTGSRLAGFVAGTLYAGAFGFINEQIWWPSSAIFCLGGAFLILAIAAIEQDALGWAVLMLIVAALGMNGVLVAALCLPVYCWFTRRRRAAGILLGVIVPLLALAFWQQTRQHDREQIALSLRGFELGAWLIGTAPLRFFSGFTTFAIPGFRTILELSPLAWLPLLASAWFMKARYGRVLLLVWTPAIVISIMVGLVRVNYYPDRYGPGVLYIADRYYYFFLFPLVTQCVLFLSSFRLPRWGTPAVFAVLAAALIASYAHFRANVVLGHFDSGRHALEQGRLLVQTIRSSSARPLLLTDAPIPIDGANKNTLTLAFLIYSEYPRGIPGVRLIDGPLDARGAVIENSILNQWAAAPPVCVINGRLQPVRAGSHIDFQKASYEEALTSGFSWWEPPFRWMDERGELHLAAAPGDLVVSAYAPVDQLHQPIRVTVRVNGRPVGEFVMSTPGPLDYRLHMPELKPGSTANITLQSNVVWHARDLLPQSLDERNLSIAILAIGFGDPHQTPQPAPCNP
ncbi:MAG: hypothetical protein ACLPWF_04100 [Bryobacteraceae bacterium]